MSKPITIELTDHGFIALHEALSRYVGGLEKKGTPARPEAAMLLTAGREALETTQAAAPAHLRGVLGFDTDAKPTAPPATPPQSDEQGDRK